ncbi:MAG: pyridoxamine 5'-phosphate oxidase family protein [Bdellovibrionota bacterium]
MNKRTEKIIGKFSSYDHAILASNSQKMDGYPFSSLIPFYINEAGIVTTLISHLAEHSKNLKANSKCSFFIFEKNADNFQNTWRFALVGKASFLPKTDSISDDMQGYMQKYPDHKRYFEELNFGFFSIQAEQYRIIEGFGKAYWVDAKTGKQSVG